MLNNSEIKVKINKDNIVPNGFYEWFLILEKCKNNTFYQIESILSEGDFFWAKEFFEEKTTYNENKVWH